MTLLWRESFLRVSCPLLGHMKADTTIKVTASRLRDFGFETLFAMAREQIVAYGPSTFNSH